VIPSRRATASRAGFLCTWIALALAPAQPARAISFGGNAAVTTDYIYRGYSETNDKGAAQLDLHISTQTGTFLGVWASTLDHKYRPWADFEVEEYIGQRFLLGSAWNASITATNYSYVGGEQRYSSDYQQISASVSYLDRWTFSVSAIPNMLRYRREWDSYDWDYYPAGRYPAYDVETSGQWLIGKGLFVTGGVGYYLSTGTDPTTPRQPTLGYSYGNVGLAYEWRNLRIDVGYFLTQKAAAQKLLPYPIANDRIAGTLSWRF
jgi:uncharacterized protein (TIGR02001 family)